MNKTFSTIAISSVIGLASITPTHAAVIDQVKSKVDAIKVDTNTLKSRTSSLISKADGTIQRLDEVGATVNTVIAETDFIKAAVAPVDEINRVFDTVRGMKDRFGELQFDPAELLQNDQLQEAIAKFKAKKAAAEERLNDPDLETFRSDFKSMLGQVSEMLMVEGDEEEQSPLQTLVELAPAPVIAALKFAVGPVFPKLSETVNALHTSTEQMRALGLLGIEMYQDYQCAQNEQAHQEKLEMVYKASQELIDVIRDLRLAHLKIEVREWELGVHGYTGTKVKTGDDVKLHIESMIVKFEAKKADFDLKREKLNFTSINCG